MMLDRRSREFYTLAITTDPPVTEGWEASFDDGDTWAAGEDATVNGNPVVRWLVAGPNAAPGAAVAVLAANVTPTIRATANPEIIVRLAPQIKVG